MGPGSTGTVGVLCALERELGQLRAAVTGTRQVAGIEVREVGGLGRPVLAVVSGVGKVRAAAAASALLAAGVDEALVVVGVCGALRRGLGRLWSRGPSP